MESLWNFDFYSISSFCPHALVRSQEKLKKRIALSHSLRSNVWSQCLISSFQKFFFFVSSVRAALSNSFSHKSHSWGCALFKHLFLLLVPLNSRFLLRFNSGLPSRMVHEYSPGRLTQILCFHSLCTQTLSNYLFSPVLENTLMHVHCKSSFYIKDALHHDGYKLSSFLYCSCCIETASLRKTT